MTPFEKLCTTSQKGLGFGENASTPFLTPSKVAQDIQRKAPIWRKSRYAFFDTPGEGAQDIKREASIWRNCLYGFFEILRDVAHGIRKEASIRRDACRPCWTPSEKLHRTSGKGSDLAEVLLGLVGHPSSGCAGHPKRGFDLAKMYLGLF